MSKAVRGGAKMASKVAKKFVKDSGEPTSWAGASCNKKPFTGSTMYYDYVEIISL